jgi:hypothetical protein
MDFKEGSSARVRRENERMSEAMIECGLAHSVFDGEAWSLPYTSRVTRIGRRRGRRTSSDPIVKFLRLSEGSLFRREYPGMGILPARPAI